MSDFLKQKLPQLNYMAKELNLEEQEKQEVQFVSNPFPGLRPYTFEESYLYFGREDETDELLQRLVENRFVAVLGSSGTGKSSFVNCGLLPILYGGYATEWSEEWEVLRCRPSKNPLGSLTAALIDEQDQAEFDKNIAHQVTKTKLKDGAVGLAELLGTKYKKTKKNQLLLIDQFEELFRIRELDRNNSDSVEAFIKLIYRAIEQSDVPVFVVITMRSDFISYCSEYAYLSKLINESQFLMPHMTREEKRETIVGPAKVKGVEIEEKLVQKILNEIGTHDYLPVMQHALMRTWEYWQRNALEGDPIDQAHYDAVGGMEEALAIHANEVFNKLTPEQKVICEKIFKTITEQRDEGSGVRNPTQLYIISEICQASIAEVSVVIDEFRGSGNTLLLPAIEETLDETSLIDISHESLMRIWGRLKDWVSEEYESIKLYKRLSEAAELHQTGQAGLWRPPDLQVALNWQEKQRPTKTWGVKHHPAYERTMAFLAFSQNEYDREQLNKEKLQKRRLITARIVSGILGSIAIVAILFLFYAIKQQQEAVKQKLKAEEQQDIAQTMQRTAVKEREEANRQASIARIESDRANQQRLIAEKQTQLAEEQKQEAIKQRENAVRAEADAQVQRQAAVREKNRAIENEEKAVAAQKEADYNAELARKLRVVSIAKTSALKSMQLDDPQLQALLAKQSFNFNESNDGDPLDPDIYNGLYYALKANMPDQFNVLPGHKDAIREVRFVGRQMYTASSDGSIWRSDISLSRSSYKPILTDEGQIFRSMFLSQDVSYIVCGTQDGKILLYDKTIGVLQRELNEHSGPVTSVVMLNDRTLLSTGDDNKVLLWNVTGEKSTEIYQSVSDILSMKVSDDGRYVGIGLSSGELVLLDAFNNYSQQLFPLGEYNQAIWTLAFSPDSKSIATGDNNGQVRVYDLETKTLQVILRGGVSARISQLQFNNGGQYLASASFDGSVRLWKTADFNSQPIIMRDHSSWVTSLDFTPDNKQLITGSIEGEIKKWFINTADLADQLCDKVDRNMTNKEWETYLGEDIPYEITCPTASNPNHN